MPPQSTVVIIVIITTIEDIKTNIDIGMFLVFDYPILVNDQFFVYKNHLRECLVFYFTICFNIKNDHNRIKIIHVMMNVIRFPKSSLKIKQFVQFFRKWSEKKLSSFLLKISKLKFISITTFNVWLLIISLQFHEPNTIYIFFSTFFLLFFRTISITLILFEFFLLSGKFVSSIQKLTSLFRSGSTYT